MKCIVRVNVSIDILLAESTLYPFIRYAKPRAVNGKAGAPVPIANDPITGMPWVMAASVQKVKPYEILVLPEGWRAKELRAVFTNTMLYAADPDTGQVADQFVYKGKLFTIMQKEDWEEYDLGYFKFYAAKEQLS